jgi:hypothetical protein
MTVAQLSKCLATVFSALAISGTALAATPVAAKPAVAMAAKPVAPVDSISDSLVKSLRCSTLSRDNVLKSLQPDAFSAARHLPVRNWPAADGLAECWALSHAQRLTFFMGRFGQSANAQQYLVPKYLSPIEDMFSGATAAQFPIFPVADVGSLVGTLQGGFVDQSGKSRAFKADIEAYQEWRFYQFGNTSLIMGGRDRSTDDNAQSFQQLRGELAVGRMPMIVLRPSMTGQHVVLVKKISPATGSGIVNFDVYDSNYPYMDNHISYDPSTQEFTAPSVIMGLDADAYSPVGLFVVDDDDMDGIQNSLYGYYAKRCQALKAARK